MTTSLRPPDRPQGDAAVSPFLRATVGYVWRIGVLLAGVYVLFMALARVENVAIAVFVALVISAILLPLTRLLARWLPRTMAAACSLILAFLLLASLFAYVGASAASQSGQLSDQLQDGITRVGDWLNRGPLNMSRSDVDNAVEQAKNWVGTHRGDLARVALDQAGLAFEVLSTLVLAVFCSLFFLSGGDRMWAWGLEQFPASRRDRIDGAVRAGWDAFSGYTRGILIVAGSNAAIVAVVLLLLRVPLAIQLAVLVFFASFIPLIGAPFAMVVATLVALAGRGPLIALAVLLMIFLIGQFEGHVLHPLVMSRAANLHPVAVALSVVSGAILGGIVGAMVAVPIVSTSWAVRKYLRDTRLVVD
jgi:putative heme transporter